MKSKFLKLDFGIQLLCLLFFLVALITGSSPAIYCLLLCQLFLGLWQIISSAIWGLVFSDYFRSQLFILAVFALAGIAIVLNLPEFRDSEFIPMVSQFGGMVMMGVYFHYTLQEFIKGLSVAHHS